MPRSESARILRHIVVFAIGLVIAAAIYFAGVAVARYGNRPWAASISHSTQPATTATTATPLEPRVQNLEASWTFLQTFIGVITAVLTVFTIFLAVASLYGITAIKGYIEQIVAAKTAEIHSELSGRLYAAHGTVMGDIAVDDTTHLVTRPGTLDEAISYSQRARDLLEHHPRYLEHVTNNLAWFYSLRNQTRSRHYEADADEALSIVRALRASKIRMRHEVIDTCARVVSTFYERFDEPESELRRAYKQVIAAYHNPDIPDAEKGSLRVTAGKLLDAADHLRKGLAGELRNSEGTVSKKP
jgi:hypothetical protein